MEPKINKYNKNRNRSIDTEKKLVVAKVGGSKEVSNMGKADYEVQTLGYNINVSLGCNVQHREYSQ